MPLLAASFESLIIFVVILLLSAVGNWLKTRKGQEPEGWDDETGPAPPPRRPGQPAPSPREPSAPAGPLFDLERELRRMLGQEPEPPPAPPPVLAPESTRQAPTPSVRPSPAHAGRSGEDLAPALPGPHFPTASPALDEAGVPAFDLARFEDSRAAHGRPGSPDASAPARIEAVRPGAALLLPSRSGGRAPVSLELASVLSSLRNPKTARQAILASVILGPPRSLER